jgi:hemerythrin-like domain-containing protein
MNISGRRHFLQSAAPAFLLAGAPPALAKRPAPSKEQETEEVTPTEDLMREHGVLKRVLLVYDEVRRRIAANTEFPPDVVAGGARIIRSFIEEYHEQLEEKHLFPRFRSQHTLVDLVDVLEEQHEHRKFGQEGFEGMVDRVAGLEKAIGIYDLKQFTPR